ncbi:diguanylate cyclase domain-containing protein [Butyrivibrio sp. VCB2006]|uniref:diguanylate cyclase domain-containing protein n=1 Tax=Butyrivibrio sp. VCB2006 TaxID=1280679 RepID=UPI0003F8AA37|nr:diguanylate cyclase [Butyrivibrio sp. VCB2006]
MKYQKAIKASVFAFVLLLLILAIVVSVNVSNQVILSPDSLTVINDNWTINSKGQIIQNDDVSQADIGVINELETVSISRIIDDVGFDNPCLTFFSIHSIVNVYLDNDLIYTYGQNFYDNKNIVPKRAHYIPLGSSYAGKILKIEFIGSRNASFSGITSIIVGERDDILTNDFNNGAIAIIVGGFLFVLGILLIILSPYLFFYHNKDLRIFFSGLISLMLGIYIMGYYRIFDLLIDNSMLNTFLEYMSLYNIPTVIIGYLMCVYSGKIRKLFVTIFIIDVGLFLTSVILHLIQYARFTDFTVVLHIASGIEFVITVIMISRDYINNKNSNIRNAYSADNIFVLGLIIFMALSLVDILRYNFYKYGKSSGETNAQLIGFTIGALIFVICLMISYLYYNIFSSNIASMQSKIIDLAYTDSLTGLSNRARCEQMMQTISEENGVYAIISLDLNKLKFVNDTLGHHEGDRLLTGFATILSDCFWDANLIGRMGGDEFIVILLEDRTINLTRRIHELYSIINDWNHKEQVFKYSASYGYAYSYEVPNGSANEVYMLADNRMYEMKREHHESGQEVIQNA